MPLIVLEGVDASGKATQTKALYDRLVSEGHTVKTITFPDYDSPSSAPVKMYLSGELGESADSVNPYAAGALFAVDRFCSYRKNWKDVLDRGGIVLADRYVTSNFIHQASKLKDEKERDEYLSFQSDFEYNRIGLPKPDIVLFLDVPPIVSLALIKERENKFSHDTNHDIHERDDNYLFRSYESAVYVAERFGFTRINCTEDGRLQPIETIAEAIYGEVKKVL